MLSTELHPLFYSAEELEAMDMQVPCALFRSHAVPLTIDFFAHMQTCGYPPHRLQKRQVLHVRLWRCSKGIDRGGRGVESIRMFCLGKVGGEPLEFDLMEVGEPGEG
jgi:hypothetical protein